MIADLLVCGLGPAGRALAHRAAVHGMRVIAVDPRPDRRWAATYATWTDDLPHWLPGHVVAATVGRPVVWGTRRAVLDRPYAVLDTGALQDALTIPAPGTIRGRAVRITAARRGRPAAVRLHDGRELTAARVVDARGLGRAPGRAEQTAYGLSLPADDEALFMDWRADNGAAPDTTPTFLYAIPLGGGRMLYEETCLAGRPALSANELRRRLLARLERRGITVPDNNIPVEQVRFPVQGARPGANRFGAAGAYIHPATGYSVGPVLAAADAVAGGAPAATPATRAVHALRLAGLRALLRLSPADVPVFFDAFFALPTQRQRAYLSGRADLPGTAATMAALFGTVPPRLRRTLMTAMGPIV
ncbi:lycopene cyclase family protein [Nocardia stercoris]|uniref:Lycopene cyclase n=1 Tax=Nocardia stercoris TaxID=2483361 RepID=A0A3M2KXT9_9NOCA|nr:lycopene cyclase family protein [Nocardia stercoris]RMI30329.1 lycopene cyclase [Nocardia stercoris]